MEDRHSFRGKRKDNGEWVIGFYSMLTKGAWLNPIQNGHYITTFNKLPNGEIIHTGIHEVDPATVGQCSGLKDIHKDMMFEGDITQYGEERGVIVFEDACFCLEIDNAIVKLSEFYDYELGIVGNIHDNPELLEGEE